MSKKRAGTLLESVATKIGSTLGVVVAEASKAVRPLSHKRPGAQRTQSRAHQTQVRPASATRTAHPVSRKNKRPARRSK